MALLKHTAGSRSVGSTGQHPGLAASPTACPHSSGAEADLDRVWQVPWGWGQAGLKGEWVCILIRISSAVGQTHRAVWAMAGALALELWSGARVQPSALSTLGEGMWQGGAEAGNLGPPALGSWHRRGGVPKGYQRACVELVLRAGAWAGSDGRKDSEPRKRMQHSEG